MTPKKYAAFRIEEELLQGLQVVWEREGISAPEQVRRAIRAWLASKGVVVKSERTRATTRRRS
jgi:hypothetical protein